MMSCEDIHIHEALDHFKKAHEILSVDWTASHQTAA